MTPADLVSGASAKLGTALDFDGVDDDIGLGNPATLQLTTSFTVSTWLNWRNDKGVGSHYFYAAGIIDTQYWGTNLAISPVGEHQFKEDGEAAIVATTTLSTATWHHVAVVTSTGINASAVKLGRVNTGYMDGLLDEVALYNREVTANEIHKAYKGFGIKLQIAASNCSNGASNAPSCSLSAGWGDSDTPFIGSVQLQRGMKPVIWDRLHTPQ